MAQQSMRNALGPLLVFIAAEGTVPVDISTKGSLLSAIAVGYFFTQVPGGALADYLGAKNVMTAALFLSATCCLLVPFSLDNFGIGGMWCVIACMGAVQGPLFPTSTVFLSRWMPKKTAEGGDEKAWGTSMLDIGISVGSLLIIPVANSLAESLGWRHAYHVIGGASLCFVALWQLLASETPQQCRFISADELRYLELNAPQLPAAKRGGGEAGQLSGLARVIGLPLSVALHPGLWAVFICHIAFNFGAYYMTNWNPTYYAEVLHLSPSEAKWHLAMPHATNLASKSVAPAFVKLLDRKGFSLLDSRRICTALGFLSAAAALLPVYRLRSLSPWVSTAAFAAANVFFGLAPCGFKSNYLDITEQYVGIISGYGNTLGTVASWAGPKLVAAELLYLRSWDAVLLTVACCNAAAVLNYVRHATVTPVEADKSE